MRLTGNNTLPSHLGYCTNIHAGEHWDEVFTALQHHVPRIKKHVWPHQAFGLGLRTSMSSVTALKEPSTIALFKQWLKAEDVYVYTINGFPYGAFHGTQVKADVYRPDWSSENRLSYTCAIADVLAELEPPDNFGSISTVPGTFRQWANAETLQAIIHNLLSCVAHCMALEQRTGVTIAIALEPEPACFLETVDDVIAFFKTELHTTASIKLLAHMSGTSDAVAESALHTYLGICYDICHAAVEFEDPLDGIARMQSAGISIVKLQLSSALKLNNVNEQTLSALQAFDEPVYLHQVVKRRQDKLTRFHDLPLAMDAHLLRSPEIGEAEEWRVHFHVPVFLSAMEHFGTTQHELSQVLNAHSLRSIAPHLEVETYTWDVLPEHYQNVPVDEAIARELDWVLKNLDHKGVANAVA